MFIRWSGILLKSNPSWPVVPEFQSSLKASAHSLEKKERDIDTLNECATPWSLQQTETMLLSTEDAFKQHVLRAKCHTLIWCKSQIPNQELIYPVGRSWSAFNDGPTMNIQPSAPVEVRDMSHLYCTYKECVDVRKCSCLLAGLLCV